MDLHAEYSRTYGGAPRADQPWHEVLAMVRRCARFDARARSIVRDGTVFGQPIDKSDAGLHSMKLTALRRAAGEIA